MGKLDGKVAIVTGSSRGIGKDIAVILAKEGARVAVAARTEQVWDPRLPGTIYSVAEEIKAFGGTALPVKCDVSKEEEVEGMVKKTLEAFGRVDILVNNAAILVPGGLTDVQIRHFDLIYRVNLKGPFLCMRAVTEPMMQQGGGYMINISSIGAIGPGTGPYPEDAQNRGGHFYGMLKSGLERFSQGLALELSPYNISVNVLSPRGGVATPGALFGRTTKEAPATTFEEAIEMGKATVFIATQEPKKYTGLILYDKDVVEMYGL